MTKETLKHKLKDKAQSLPLLPGVYLMEDAWGNIIYVGKSKALKNRVSTYFGGSKKPSKVERMVRGIHDFSVQQTDTELDALILECRLIKKYRPIYNRLLKQDHRYRYLFLNPEEQRPRLRLVREQTHKGIYFGPYDKKQGLFEAVEALNEYYELPDCKDYDTQESCLTYKRQKCLGPCKSLFAEEVFKKRLQAVCLFLQGEDEGIIKAYEKEMAKAVERLAFEEAALLKEKWQALKSLHFKKEAMDFACSNQITLLLLECPAGGKKLSLWIGATMIWSKVMKRQPKGKNLERMIQGMKNALLEIEVTPIESITKEAMDEIQIVYSLFKKQTPKTYQFFNRQLDAIKNEEALKKALAQLLE